MTVGEVVESRAAGFVAGDTVWHALGWRDYAVVRAGTPGARGSRHADAARHRARAAAELSRPARRHGPDRLRRAVPTRRISAHGDVVWVSAAAGAVGSLAAQFAKLRGHRVIGSAGSDEKVTYLRDEIGFDAAFNHRRGPVAELLADAAPDGIDVYFDNVGGEHLEAALGALRRHGRVALCGAISQYERPDRRAGAAQPVPGDRERIDVARVPGQQLCPPDGRDAARGRGLAARRKARATASRSPTGSSARPRRWCGCSRARRSARRWSGSTPDEPPFGPQAVDAALSAAGSSSAPLASSRSTS